MKATSLWRCSRVVGGSYTEIRAALSTKSRSSYAHRCEAPYDQVKGRPCNWYELQIAASCNACALNMIYASELGTKGA